MTPIGGAVAVLAGLLVVGGLALFLFVAGVLGWDAYRAGRLHRPRGLRNAVLAIILFFAWAGILEVTVGLARLRHLLGFWNGWLF